MSSLLPRHATPFAEDLLAAFPATVIQGARQVGKSTFASQITADRDAVLVTLDDETMRAAAMSEPAAFVEQAGSGTLVIDELQRAPELLLAIKASIDRDRRPGRFVLTGSSNLLRLSRTPDSLAGRATTIELRGLSVGEAQQKPDDLVSRLRKHGSAGRFRSSVTREVYCRLIARGGYPEVRTLRGRIRGVWFDSYAERLLERDISDIAPRVDSGRIASVLRLIAGNQAGELVKARVARDAGVPETSVSAYLDLLETMYLTSRLRPWTPNLTSREAARPKVMVSDSGLALRLARISEEQLLPIGSAFMGPAFEAFIVAELLKQRGWSAEEYELFHFRDRSGVEVDVIVEFNDGSVIGLEVKSGSTLKPEHLKGLRVLRDKLGERFLGGYVINTATESSALGDRLWGLPASALWEM